MKVLGSQSRDASTAINHAPEWPVGCLFASHNFQTAAQNCRVQNCRESRGIFGPMFDFPPLPHFENKTPEHRVRRPRDIIMCCFQVCTSNLCLLSGVCFKSDSGGKSLEIKATCALYHFFVRNNENINKQNAFRGHQEGDVEKEQTHLDGVHFSACLGFGPGARHHIPPRN